MSHLAMLPQLRQQLEICEKIGVGVAAVLMEPIQGEAGAIVPPDDFWPRIRDATKKHGTLLIADEVQTGLGRTGKLWGVDHWDVVPDIIAVAKSLGGGVMPICSVITTEEIFAPFMYPNPFLQTTTTGGGALACSAAIAAINVTVRDKLWEVAKEKGDYIMPKSAGIGGEISKGLRESHRQGLAHWSAFPDSRNWRAGGCGSIQARRSRGWRLDQRPDHPHRAAVGHHLRRNQPGSQEFV